MKVTVGGRVKVRGKAFRVLRVDNMSHLGSKFFGKYKFLLRDDDGNMYECAGKTVAHNARLEPVE